MNKIFHTELKTKCVRKIIIEQTASTVKPHFKDPKRHKVMTIFLSQSHIHGQVL